MDTMPPSEGGGAGSIPAEDTRIKFSGILPIDSAARSAESYGFIDEPRIARLVKRRFYPKISLAETFFAKRLAAPAVLVKNSGHLNNLIGWFRLPQYLDVLNEMIK